MIGDADQILRATDVPVVDKSKSDSGTESDSPAASTSSNTTIAKIADKTIPDMSDYWNKSTITKVDRQAYHSVGWLTDGLESSISNVDVTTVDGSTVVYFESHLVAGLGLPPSKFLVAIMNFLGCELFYFNPNTIAVLSCFTMLYECWSEIAPDTSLFWYFYSLARYDKVIYSRIGLSLHRSRWKAYIDGTFKGCWKGSSQRWFLVDMHVPPQWANRHMLSPLINNKRGKPEMTPCLTALVKKAAELHDVSLRAYHCVEEFILWWIRPLGRQDALSYECPLLADCHTPF
jgi:hypothetical protein